MKQIIALIGVMFFLSGCATNGGPFDPSFWVKKVVDTKDVVVDAVVEVVDEVVAPTPKEEKPVVFWNNTFTKCHTFDSNGDKVDCVDPSLL